MIEIAVVAVVALIVAVTWMAVLGFKESMKQGLAIVLVPPYVLYYGWTRYRRCLKPMILFASALVALSVLLAYVLLQKRDPVQTRRNAARAQIQLLIVALDTYKSDVGVYPTNEEGLQALRVRLSGAGNWNGPYFRKEIPVDPWGRPFVYRYRGPLDRPDVISYGADGRPGGEGVNADILE